MGTRRPPSATHPERALRPRRSRRGRAPALGAALVVIALLSAAVLAAGALVAGAATSRHSASATVTGLVVIGPMLPIDPGASVSWPPEKAVVWVSRPGASTVLRTLHTGADGRFTVSLAPGRYRFSAQPAGVSTMPICHAVTLRLRGHEQAHVRLWLDTGVRFPDAQNVTPGTPPGGDQRYPQGLEGTTRRGPITPVAKPGEPNDEACAATLYVYHPNGVPAAVVYSTAADGFTVALPAGPYVVDPHSGVSSSDRGAPFSIRVPRREWLSLTVSFDTGIR